MAKSLETKLRNRRSTIRKSPRSSVRVECRRGAYGFGSNIAARLLDISQSGARILLKEMIDLGKEVELGFSAYGLSGRLKVCGNIVWVVPMEDGTCAVGIAFQKRLAYSDVLMISRP